MEICESAARRIGDDFRGAKLGDPRRSRRAAMVAEQIARKPSASLPVAAGSDAALQGVYRFANNEDVSFSALHDAQAQQTAKRARAAGGSAWVLHDTTDATFAGLDPKDVGYLPTGKPGFLIHVSLVLDGARWRYPRGVIHCETIHRATRSKHKGKKRSGRETAMDPQSEGPRWWRGIEAASKRLEGVEVIHIADRESDSHELFSRCLAAGYRFVFRVRVPTRRCRVATSDSSWTTVHSIAASCEGAVEREVVLSGRAKKPAPGMNRGNPPRKGRLATLHFSATRIELAAPQYAKEPFAQSVTLNLVNVVESNPPEGESPVSWLLYTTEPIETPEQIAKIVDMYRSRWAIEEFNAALKTGCAYEARQFVTRHALLNILALSLPVACEMLALRSQARDQPEALASEVLRPTQIQVLQAFAKNVPAVPTARQALLAVAALGGHLKRNGEPGWTVLMRGMQTLLDYERAWIAGRASVQHPPPSPGPDPGPDL